MQTVRCLIVDDETLAQELVEAHLKKIPNLTVEGKCHTAMEAMAVLNSQQIDLLFLDIEMPDLTGIDLLKSLQSPPLTIFTTAYSEYALEGYELNVVDYLLKPIRFDRLFKAVSKALPLLQKGESVTSHPSSEVASDFLFVKSDYKAVKIKFDHIIYVEGMQKYVKFHLEDERVTTLMSLSKLEGILPEDRFFRCQKSFIVNLKKIKGIDGNQLIMENDAKVAVSKSLKGELVRRLDSYGLL